MHFEKVRWLKGLPEATPFEPLVALEALAEQLSNPTCSSMPRLLTWFQLGDSSVFEFPIFLHGGISIYVGNLDNFTYRMKMDA